MPQDSLLLLRDGTVNLTATANGAGVDFGAGDVNPFTYEHDVPQATGTAPTYDAEIEESDDNSTWRNFLSVAPQIIAAGVYFVTGKSDARWRRHAALVGGTGPNFGGVVIAPVVKGQYTKY